MHTDDVIDLKAFVPARDYALSRRFYADLGFVENFGGDEVAELQAGGFRFLLQNFYDAGLAGNFMLQLAVEDAGAWWEHIERTGLVERYPGVKARPPAMQPWGLRVLYLTDPSGVLWHIADRRQATG